MQRAERVSQKYGAVEVNIWYVQTDSQPEELVSGKLE